MPFSCPNIPDYYFNYHLGHQVVAQNLELEVEQPLVMTSTTFEASNSSFFGTTTEPFVSSSQEMAPGAGSTGSFAGIGMPFPCLNNPADYYFNYHLGRQVLLHHLELEEVEQPLDMISTSLEASNSSFFGTTTEPFVSVSSREMAAGAGSNGSFDGVGMPFPCPDNTAGYYVNYNLALQELLHHLELEEVKQPLVMTSTTFEASDSSFFSTTTAPFVSATSQEMVPGAGITASFDGIRMPFDNGDHQLQQELKMRDDHEQVMGGKVERHIVVIRTQTRLETLYDGFKWRKYGKKMVKCSPHPRHYYRCSIRGCQVKKIVERDAEDSSILRTTYVGKHNHAS